MSRGWPLTPICYAPFAHSTPFMNGVEWTNKAYFLKNLQIDGKCHIGTGSRRGRHFRAVHGAIQRVALDGNAASFADEALELYPRGELSGFGAGVVIDFFLDDRAVQVVRAEAQGDLRDAWREHHPVGFDVVEVVEEQARNCDRL